MAGSVRDAMLHKKTGSIRLACLLGDIRFTQHFDANSSTV